MSHASRLGNVVVVAAVVAACGLSASAQTGARPLNDLPNPYRAVERWGQLPEGRTWGSTSAVDIDTDGQSVWVAERCGENSCARKSDPAVLKFDASGRLVRSFGAGMFVFPHGIHVDAQGNVWVTDAQGSEGKGHQVFKFSPDGKVLLTLGRAGVAGDGPGTFDQPSDVLVAPNGDIFVADGHDKDSNARIVKFRGDGTFVKTWGRRGSAPGEFDTPHALAMDSRGRLFVGDRANNRIQIFDQDGTFLEEWKQFGRPSGLYIDRNDMIYVADSESTDQEGYGYNPGWKRGLRIGSARDGRVMYFVPDPSPGTGPTSAAEGVAADAQGNLFGAEVASRQVKKYVKR